DELDAGVLADTLNIVLKYERDMQRAVEVLPRLVDPNRELAAAGHSHGPGPAHEHGDQHGHAGEHGHRDEDRHGQQDGADSRDVRAAKDQPGRHDEGY